MNALLKSQDPLPNWGSLQAPYSQEAEEATIGAILVNPVAYFVVAAFLKADDFFILRHRYIWEALTRLHERSEPIDYLTVMQELKDAQRLTEIGGAAYLMQLINSTPTSVHAEVYGKLVEAFAGRRRLMAASDEIKRLALDGSIPFNTVESEAVRIVTEVQRASVNDLVPMKLSIQTHMDMVEKAIEKPNDMLGLPSCLNDLNRYLHGYEKTRLYVGAGRPGMGKTSHLINEAAYLASLGQRIAFFTLEMSTAEVVNCIVSAEIEVDSHSIKSGKLEKMGRYPQYLAAASRIGGWKLFVDDTNSITHRQITAKCQKMMYEHGLDMVFVDYLQLMGADGYHENRTKEVGANAQALKEMAKELNIPVFTAAQLNRDVDSRQDKHPQLSDLRESGEIEQHADVVMFYYREDYYYPEPPLEGVVKTSNVEIGIAKNRDGETGVANVGFTGKYKKFVNVKPPPISERVKFNTNGKGD